jgi:hypothetical protein
MTRVTRVCDHAGLGVHGLSYARHVPGRSHLGRRAGEAPTHQAASLSLSLWACRVISCHGSEGLASDAVSAAAAAAGVGLIRGGDRGWLLSSCWGSEYTKMRI